MMEGEKMAVDEINSAGGVLGRKLELVFLDDGSDTEKGVTAAKQLIERDKVDILMGTQRSGVALALLAYTGTLLVDGNGFVAAFVGGLVFGNTAGPGGEKQAYFVEQSADLAAMISWLIFGALAVPAIGHPILGDRAYGGGGDDAARVGLTRPFLHAWRLRFLHPVTGEQISLEDPLPGELVDVLTRVRLDQRP